MQAIFEERVLIYKVNKAPMFCHMQRSLSPYWGFAPVPIQIFFTQGNISAYNWSMTTEFLLTKEVFSNKYNRINDAYLPKLRVGVSRSFKQTLVNISCQWINCLSKELNNWFWKINFSSSISLHLRSIYINNRTPTLTYDWTGLSEQKTSQATVSLRAAAR